MEMHKNSNNDHEMLRSSLEKDREVLEKLNKSALISVFYSRINLVKDTITSSENFYISFKQSNINLIILMLSVFFGSIINYYVTENSITTFLFLSFIFIYIYTIFKYIYTLLLIKNFEIEINSGKKYLYDMLNIRDTKGDYLEGSLLINYFYHEIYIKKFKYEYLVILTYLQYIFLFSGILFFSLQIFFTLYDGLNKWNWY